MHTHVLTYQADIDILGQANTMLKHELVADKVEYPWSGGKQRNTMKMVKGTIKNEDEGKLVSARLRGHASRADVAMSSTGVGSKWRGNVSATRHLDAPHQTEEWYLFLSTRI